MIVLHRPISLFLSLALLVAALPAAAAENALAPKKIPQVSPMSDTDIYRGFVWGVSKQDVRKFEKGVTFYEETDDTLSFLSLPPDGFRRKITYHFINDKLAQVQFEYVELNLPDSQRILNMFGDEEHLLTKKYGKPLKEEAFWKDRLYEKHPDYWGRALYSEDLKLRVEWLVKDTNVVLVGYYDGNYYQILYTVAQVQPETNQQKNILNLPTAPAPAPVKQP